MKISKILKYLPLAILCEVIFASCDDYLAVELQDQMTIEEVFAKRYSTERYLAHVYSFMPYEYDYIGTNKDLFNHMGGDGCVVPRSDEAMFSWYQWMPFLQFTTESYGPTNWEYNRWPLYYQGIAQATIFMNNVDACPEITAANKEIMKAEARFLRAFYYFVLFRQYGPVYIWGDQDPDKNVKPEECDRHTVDQNVDFMVEEMDKAIAVLPLKVDDPENWDGRVTKGAAMAAKARLLLYAARPLYNGCEWYKGIKNYYGDYLFPQENDPQKWEKAAKAAKDVIDLGMYSLARSYEPAKSKLENAIASYQKVGLTPFNEETIWGCYGRDIVSYSSSAAYFYRVRSQPPSICMQGYGGFCPSLKLVDTYPMEESGRFPVTGYNGPNPIVDDASGYTHNGFTEGWVHPIEKTKGAVKVHNSCVGRDARFYASIFANGYHWIDNYVGGNPIVTFFTGGTSPYVSSGDCVKVGYMWRRFLDPTLNTQSGLWGQFFWNYFRLAEVYLNYAEACNEKPNRDEAEALRYINLVRERAGLNRLEEAYPEVKGNKELLRELLAKERMVELAFECHRFYDRTQWMTAETEFAGPNYSLNLLATNYEASYERTNQVWQGADRVFTKRMHLHPINQDVLNEMKNVTQNYGW